MTHGPRIALGAILLVYLSIASVYAISVPAWNAPDEPAHYNYVRQIAETGTLPVLSPGDWSLPLLQRLVTARFPEGESIDGLRYEGWQPPLYYLTATPLFRATQGLSNTKQVTALRFLSVIYGGVALLVLYAIASQVLGVWHGVVAAGFVAFNPMWIFISASINNDSLAVLILSGILWLLVRAIIGDSNSDNSEGWVGRSARIGLLLGAGLLTKSTTYIAVFLVALVIIVPRMDRSWREGLIPQKGQQMMVVFGLAAITSGWWFVRNAWVYGGLDFMGRARHDAIVTGQPVTGALTMELARFWSETAFRSFWAQFGWMGVVVDQRIYLAFGVLSILALVGLIWWGVSIARRELHLSPDRAWALGVLALSGLLTLATLVYYNLTFLQPQGRYLFPALAPISTFFVIGAGAIVPYRLRPVAAAALIMLMAILDIVCLYRFILPDLRS